MKRKIFSDRKVLMIFLGVIIVSIMTLTLAYAALSVTLNITGSAKVNAANWDVHFDGVYLVQDSVQTSEPTVVDATTISFSTTLSKPGEFYGFTAYIRNDGSIDAMIDSITISPTLTSEQAKFLKYEVSYSNGESINSKQLIRKGTYVDIFVKIEYRDDISAADLPSDNLDLEFEITFNYAQDDGTGNRVTNNGMDYLGIMEIHYNVFEYEHGMTWNEWLLSEYNIYGYKNVDNKVYVETFSSCVWDGDGPVKASDPISDYYDFTWSECS